MPAYNVPQFIDVEDKIVGPLTWKQLAWTASGVGMLVLLWNFVPPPIFYFPAFPIAAIFLAFAFYKPQGLTLASFIFYGIMYAFRPKQALWERPLFQSLPTRPKLNEESVKPITDKRLSPDTLRDLAGSLDSYRQK